MREFRVYDFNRLVGNIGGGMGLFVGLSFYSIVSSGLQVALKWICSGRNKSRF